MLQATPQATPGTVSTRQRMGMLDGGFQEQTRIPGREISFACDAIIMDSTLSCTISLGRPVGVPTAMYAPPLRYKKEALAAHRETLSSSLKSSDSQPLKNTSNTTHSGRRVLRFGGPNHSKSLVFIMFLSEIELVLANPRAHSLWA